MQLGLILERCFQNIVRADAPKKILIALNLKRKAKVFCYSGFKDSQLSPFAFHFLCAKAWMTRVFKQAFELLVSATLEIWG
jgi:hypothetical protein